MKKTILRPRSFAYAIAIAFIAATSARADELVKSDFTKGQSLDSLGWKSKSTQWEIYDYTAANHNTLANNPGPVLRFKATPKDFKGRDWIVKTFPLQEKPSSMTLTFDGGWGWGHANQGADYLGAMLLDDDGNGYLFAVHRTNDKWAATWSVITKWANEKDKAGKDIVHWAADKVDATQPSLMEDAGLQTFTIKRKNDESWEFSGAKWTGAIPIYVVEPTVTTKKFSQVALLGGANFDDIVYANIHLFTGDGAADPNAIPVLK